jgi:type 1 glutamine amidotransferase
VLVFTAQHMWDHLSNPVAGRAVLTMCETYGYSVTVSHDPEVFESDRLRDTDVVMFSITSGVVLDDRARGALEPWLRDGGGLVGLHTADATEQTWPYFGLEIGATFKTHAPGVFAAVLTNEAPQHPITADLPARWARTDEYHVFNERPEASEMTMLLAVDESTFASDYPADARVGYHPIAWAHELNGGRVFYSCMGHPIEAFADRDFLEFLARGIAWTARRL